MPAEPPTAPPLWGPRVNSYFAKVEAFGRVGEVLEDDQFLKKVAIELTGEPSDGPESARTEEPRVRDGGES
jgi:hypothetical protein